MAKTKVVVFDIIETMLDLNALRAGFARLTGSGDDLDRWFAQLIQAALIATVTDRYADFGALGRHALEMVARAKGRRLTDDERAGLLSGVRKLPAHSDVIAALTRLKQAGFRLATLTNSTAEVAEAQLTNAGLGSFFERAVTADSIRTFKPAAAVYIHGAVALGISIGEMRLVAAHDWDVTGAIRAGAKAAFVARPGKVLGPLSETPDIVAPDLVAMAERIVTLDGARG